MSRAYDEIMDRVVVTADMRRRVLEAVAQQKPSRRRAPFLPYVAAAACVALIAAGALAWPALRQETPGELPGNVQVVAPQMTAAVSLDELSQLVGFDVPQVTDVPFTVTEVRYTAFGSDMAQVQYVGDSQILTFRMAPGSGDPSGDYTAYTDEAAVGDATLKGDGGAYVLAVWTVGDYTCSLQSDVPMAAAEWETILASVR